MRSRTVLAPPAAALGEADGAPAPGGGAAGLRLRRWCALAAALVAAAVAVGLALHELGRPGGLYGVSEYDDGAYFGAAIRLVDGLVPYRDFVFVQPPGITLLMAPVALLAHGLGSRGAMAVARLLTAGVAGLNVLLLGHLLRHRGVVAVTVACFVLALFPPAIFADRTMMLEPYLILCCLVGAILAFRGDRLTGARGRLVAAGVVFGFGGTVKVWAVVPLLALVAGAAWRSRRAAGLVLGGAAAGFVLPCLPFFLLAPRAFWHDIVTAQLARAASRQTDLGTRLVNVVGVRGIRGVYQSQILGVRVALVVGVFLVLASLVPSAAGRGSRLETFALLAAVGSIGAILVPPEFYSHYAYFSATFLALLLGLAADRLARLVVRAAAPARGRTRRLALGVVAMAAAAGVVAGIVPLVAGEAAYADTATAVQVTDPGPAIRARIPPGACAISDTASLLIAADRFTSTRRDCPSLVDATGTWLAMDPRHPPSKLGHKGIDPKLVALWKGWFERAQYVVEASPLDFRIPWTPALMRWFLAHYRRIPTSSATVWARVTAPQSGVALRSEHPSPKR